MGKTIEDIANATGKSVEKTIRHMQYEGPLREKINVTDPSLQTLNPRMEGKAEMTPDGPVFSDKYADDWIKSHKKRPFDSYKDDPNWKE